METDQTLRQGFVRLNNEHKDHSYSHQIPINLISIPTIREQSDLNQINVVSQSLCDYLRQK